MAAKTLYLIDGHAQIYRAYYAPFRALTSPTGEPTRAVHVFVQMVLNLLRDRKPDYLIMAMDVSDKTVFRTAIDPEYKANREASPEDLGPQIERIVTIMAAMKIPILRLKGFEADDLMATLCDKLAGPDIDVFLVSRDKDLDQLLNEHVRMYDPMKDQDIDVAAMIESKGYGPDQAIEAQMLMGDSTDNIKGVTGVGPKRAAQLLQKYGSIEAIIEHADELTPKLRENVLAFRDRAETVRQLVTLRRDVDFKVDLEAADISKFEPGKAVPILSELGLNRLVDRVAGPAPRNSAPKSAKVPGRRKKKSTAPTLFDMSAEVDEARYELVDTEKALAGLARELIKRDCFAFDTETTGLVSADTELVGISFSSEPEAGQYVPVRGDGPTVSEAQVRKHLGPVFANENIRKCGQNLKYDIGVLSACGIEVRGIEFDTMIASFLLHPGRRSHGIDSLAQEILGVQKLSAKDLLGTGKKQTTFDALPTRRTCTYAAEDSDIAWRLRDAFEKQMVNPEIRSLFQDLEMPLVEVLASMEREGVALDTDFLGTLSNEMADRLVELEHDIHEAAGHPFNVNSTQQLAEVLFDELGLRVVKRTRTLRSTDAEVLAVLAAETNSPIPSLLLEHRELAKLKGTYVDALPELVSPKTGRVHPSFHQTGAVTGRLSCSDPNLQNIPIRTEAGARIRRAFVPGSPDRVLLKADYSQIELRVLAHFSRDRALTHAFENNHDIHTFVASQIHGVPLEEVTKSQRASAKTVNFGIVYGQTAFGLAKQTGMPVGEARQFIERYFQQYPDIRGFLDSSIQHARDHGFVKTLLGRRREIADINSRNRTARNAAERFAANTVIQGTAADLIKQAMVNIHRRIQKEGRSARMLIQVHDELVFEIPKADLTEEAKMIAHEMATAIPLEVPIKVDVAHGDNWLDVEDL